MRRPRPTDDWQKVKRFLPKVSLERWAHLERLGPQFVWVIRHVYGPIPTSQEHLARCADCSSSQIQRFREQALHILGYKGPISDREAYRTKYLEKELELRAKLYYLRTHAQLGSGDREIIDLALIHGAFPREIERQSDWKEADIKCAFRRLTRPEQFKKIELGGRVRITALREVAKSNVNAKAELEIRLLEALRDGTSFLALEEEWGTTHSNLESIVIEVRNELSHCPESREGFARLLARSEAMEGAPTARINWLNSMLLPSYRRFRKANRPFSVRELEYLRLRGRGKPIKYAAQRAMGLSLPRGSVIDRAFLGCIPEPKLEFPAELPQPPFTTAQKEFAKKLGCVPV